MEDEIWEAIEAYVRACGGDTKNQHTESMEQLIAKQALVEAIESRANYCVEEGFAQAELAEQETPGTCPNCPCSNCNAL